MRMHLGLDNDSHAETEEDRYNKTLEASKTMKVLSKRKEGEERLLDLYRNASPER